MTTASPDRFSEELRNEVEQVWPELTRFYGLQPSELARLPKWMRNAYVKGMSRLHAREQLALVTAVGFPHMKAAERKRLSRTLMNQAGFAEAPPQQATSHEAIAAFGIPVTVVDAEGNPLEEHGA